MYVNKWAGFSVSVVCTISAGLAYCFSLYSNQLKEAFGYDQKQIQAIGSATNLGGYASIISGLVYDSMLDWDGRGPRYLPQLAFYATCNSTASNVLRLAAG